MQKRKLWNSSLEVSTLGLGCKGMSMAYGTAEDKSDAQPIGRLGRPEKIANALL